MASDDMVVGAARPKQKYRGWLTIRRSKPSKKKYNVQDAVPHNSPIPDEITNGRLMENDDEDVPTLIQRLKVIETVEDHHNPKALIATQRHLIDVLQKENVALRLLRTQVERLRRENGELKAEVRLLKSTTGIVNGVDENTKISIEANEKHGKNHKGNGDSKRPGRRGSNDSNLKENGSLTNGHNGLTNGHLHHSEVDGLLNGMEVNGVDNGQSGVRHPNQRLVKETGPGTSGTSLITVSCLQRTVGKLHDCDETLQARLKSRMAAKGVDLIMNPWVHGQDAHQITVVFCLCASARVTTDINRALEGIGANSEVVLVMFHNVAAGSDRQDPQSDTLGASLQNVCLVTDLFFSKQDGLYRCEQNDRSMARLFRLFEILC